MNEREQMLTPGQYVIIGIAFLISAIVGCCIREEVSWKAIQQGFLIVGVIITIYAAAVFSQVQNTDNVGWLLLGIACLAISWPVIPGLRYLVNDLRHSKSTSS